MTALPKQKPIRLKGRTLHDLYQEVYTRDHGCCVKCNRWIEPGTPPHHIILKGRGGSDTEENLEMQCLICHDKAHN